jgi:hypothetical protein
MTSEALVRIVPGPVFGIFWAFFGPFETRLIFREMQQNCLILQQNQALSRHGAVRLLSNGLSLLAAKEGRD